MKIAEQVDSILDWGGLRKQIVLLAVSGASLLGSLFNLFPHAHFDLSWIAIVLCGIPLVAEATLGLVTKFDIRAGVLVSIALISSIYVGEYFAAGEVAFIMQLGELLEDLTVARARAGIERLVKLTPATARRLLNGKEEILPAANIVPGDMLRVLPGETVPVDGVIVSGQTSLNQANITGESLPVDKTVGDEVFSDQYIAHAVGLVKSRVNFVGELWEQARFFFVRPEGYAEKDIRKRWKPETPDILRALIEVLRGIDDFTSHNSEEIVLGWIKEHDYHLGNVMNAFRLTVVGECKGPHMFDISELLGKDETIARIEAGIENIRLIEN